MPDDSSPFDDPFADLFGKLPDARPRAGAESGAVKAEASDSASPEPPVQPAGAADATGDSASTTSADAAPAPTSRRAARAARQREAAAATEAPAPDSTTDEDPTATRRLPEVSPEVSPELYWAAVAAPPVSTETTASTSSSVPAERPATVPLTTMDDLFLGDRMTGDIGMTRTGAKPRRRRRGLWIALGVVAALLVGAGAAGWWAWSTYEDKIREVLGWEEPADYAAGEATGEVDVTIVSGDTGSIISQTLYDAGVTRTPEVVYDYLIASGQDPVFQPGVFRLQQKMTAAAAVEALLNSENRIDNTVVITEGLSADDALQRISDATGLSYDDLATQAADYTQFGIPAEAPSIEGFLFPATYTFDPGVTAHDVLARMVDETFSRLDALGVAEADRLSVLTLASIVQKESGPDVADMAKIARVFLNRIDAGMPLQSDATVAYGASITGTVWTTEEQRADATNIYNTYAHTGLPPGPISNPGEDAINAALHPADGTWLYFVAVNLQTGETVFSNTYEEHLVAVEQMQEWCAQSENAAYCV